MTRRNYILAMLLAAATLLSGASPAMAARLAGVSGEAGDEQTTRTADFRLSGQTEITLAYDITAQGNGASVQVHIYKQLPNGRWSHVSTPVSTRQNAQGTRSLTLPAGNYQIRVVATKASYSVTLDN